MPRCRAPSTSSQDHRAASQEDAARHTTPSRRGRRPLSCSRRPRASDPARRPQPPHVSRAPPPAPVPAEVSSGWRRRARPSHPAPDRSRPPSSSLGKRETSDRFYGSLPDHRPPAARTSGAAVRTNPSTWRRVDAYLEMDLRFRDPRARSRRLRTVKGGALEARSPRQRRRAPEPTDGGGTGVSRGRAARWSLPARGWRPASTRASPATASRSASCAGLRDARRPGAGHHERAGPRPG